MTIPQITPITTPVAQRTDPPEIFTTRADRFVAEVPIMVDEINLMVADMNATATTVAGSLVTVLDSEQAAVAAANFKGQWATLSGALSIPATVSHNGSTWILLENIADVTASEPSESNGDWLVVSYVLSTTFNSRTIASGAGLKGGGDLSTNRTISADIATASDLHAGEAEKMVAAQEVYAANAPVALSGSPTITPDFKAGRNFTVTLTGNRTLGNPTNQVAGQSGMIFIKQNATGGRTLSFGSHWRFSLALPQADISPNAEESISYYVKANGDIRCSYLESYI